VFERSHHRRIATLLDALHGPLLRGRGCLFGGGTAMALRFGEYRESVAGDFLVSRLDDCRHLRNEPTGPRGPAAITRGPGRLAQVGELRAHRCGIRTRVSVDCQPSCSRSCWRVASPCKRRATATWRGIATPTPLDMATSKLLANSDRWPDDGVFSPDLIDLAMMRPSLALLRSAVAKAEGAYGASILRDLGRAIDRMQSRTGWLERCMEAMGMQGPPAVVWQRIRALRRVLPRAA
jgi:hypothetical protein